MSNTYKAGYVSIVGRPNVGKSTLLNHLIKQKISITSRKPQTTRSNVIGIKSESGYQLVFVDTPGIHQDAEKALNRYMNRVAMAAMSDVDLVLFVVDKDDWTKEDDAVSAQLMATNTPLVIAVNKVDQCKDKAVLIPQITQLAARFPKAEIVPVSALRGTNLDELEKVLAGLLPASEAPLFPENQVTDKSMRFMAAEMIREKVIRQLGAELPYATAVEIEEFLEEPTLISISAVILAEREGQKRMLVGEKGQRIKSIGTDARVDMEKMFDKKVMLNLWVKVKSGWSDDDRALRSLGLDDSGYR